MSHDQASTPHRSGQRVQSIFGAGVGVVVESDPQATLIEFDDEEDGERYVHRKWLPTRHWEPADGASSAPTTDASKAPGMNPNPNPTEKT